MYHDQALILEMSRFTSKCKLDTEWGYQVSEVIQDVMTTCENIRASTPPNAMVKNLSDALFEKLTSMIEPDWIELASLSLKLVYAKDASVKDSVRDTIDAIFIDENGAKRMMVLRTRIALFVFQRLLIDTKDKCILPEGAEGSKLLYDVALTENKIMHDMSKYFAFWDALLGSKTVGSLDAKLNELKVNLQDVKIKKEQQIIHDSASG